MIKIIGILLVCFVCQIFSNEKQDTLLLKENDRIYQSKNIIAFVSKISDSECIYLIKIREKGKSLANFSKSKKVEFKISSCSFRSVSISDSGLMIMSYLVLNEEGDILSQCINPAGKVLWERHYNDFPDAEKLKDMILSPNGKYAIMTTDDTCILISGKNGKKIPSKLENRIQGNYTAFFNPDSKVIIVTDNWQFIKYDPEIDSIVQEKKIEDPTGGKLKIILNRNRLNKMLNNENTILLVELLEKTTDTSYNTGWFFTFDDNLSIRMFRNVMGMITPSIAIAGDVVIVSVYFKKDTTDHHETRLYTEQQQLPIILNDRSESDWFSHASKTGDDIIYHPDGSKRKFWKYNLKKQSLNKDFSDNILISEKDSLHFIKLTH